MGRSNILKKADEMLEQADLLQAEAQKLVKAENDAPVWLKDLIIVIANELGITSKEFTDRVKIQHPTPADPVLLIDGKTYLAWM